MSPKRNYKRKKPTYAIIKKKGKTYVRKTTYKKGKKKSTYQSI